MIAMPRRTARLIDRLPPVRGRYTENAPLNRTTWFRVGGPAEILFRPADAEDLAAFLATRPADVPVTVIGVGSNLLVRDGGVRGVVIRLGRAFAEVAAGETEISVGAAALDVNVALGSRRAGIAGLEFLAGIPGTIGGALRMNAGAFGSEIADIFVSAKAMDPAGAIHTLGPDDMGFAYRRSVVPEDWFFIAAVLRGCPGDANGIAARIKEVQATREETQPTRTPTGGSTFKNPDAPEARGRKAWELIDEAGCRGLARGGAMVSEKHCNFLINTGAATAADLEGLGEEVRRRVFAATGVPLDWEIRRIGVPAEGAARPIGEARR
ncbi:MAG: UDP-N-acetylmuramate dehydrogenase [Alphaproteobacteria bacterium]